MAFLKWALLALVLICLWVATALFGGLEGWWLNAVAPQGDNQAFIAAIKDRVKQNTQNDNAANIAWVLIDQGKVVDEGFVPTKSDSNAKHTNTVENTGINNNAIDSNTLFPAASLSKFITAYAVLKLVDTGKITPDEPIAPYLTRWHLPKSEFNQQSITINQLLSHTAGLTDGLGFADYQADEILPSLEQTLTQPKAGNGETRVITVEHPPGSQWQYSGGGYLLLQLLVEEITGMSFEQWVQQSVFYPLDMTRSNYQFLGNQNNIATSYNLDGSKAPYYQYASSAATGLNTSAQDLTRLALALIQSDDSNPLRQPTGFTLGAAIWGPGAMLYAPTGNNDYVYGHDGSNEPAINSALRINPDSGDAIIVLSTGTNNLASELGYEWTLWQTGKPDFLAFEQALASAFLPAGIGIVVILVGVVGLNLFRRRR